MPEVAPVDYEKLMMASDDEAVYSEGDGGDDGGDAKDATQALQRSKKV